MRRRALVCSASFATLILASIDASAHREPFAQCGLSGVRYEAIDLGALGEGTAAPSALNDRGQVTGTANLSDTLARAFVWDCERGMQNIGAVDEGDYASIAMDINNRGEVVGQSVTFEFSKAFIWDRVNGMRGIGSQEGGLAYTINDWGDVLMMDNTIWNARDGSRPTQEVIGFEFTSLAVTNNRRHIAGLRVAEDFRLRFFDWSQRGGRQDFAVAPQSGYTEVQAMNDRGDIIGAALNALFSGSTVPYLVTRDGSFQFLTEVREGIYGLANGINNRRQIVGSIESESGSAQYLWDPKNGMRLLRDLVSRDLQGLNVGGSDINNWGWISGGTYDPATNEWRAVLFVPIRERSNRFDKISELKGAQLCRALNQVKIDALLTCLLTGE